MCVDRVVLSAATLRPKVTLAMHVMSALRAVFLPCPPAIGAGRTRWLGTVGTGKGGDEADWELGRQNSLWLRHRLQPLIYNSDSQR